MDGPDHFHPLFNAQGFIAYKFINKNISDLAKEYLAAVKRNGSVDFQFINPGTFSENGDIQNPAIFRFNGNIHFILVVTFRISEIIRNRQQFSRHEIGGKDLIIAEPAKQPEIRCSVFFMCSVNKQSLGAKMIGNWDGLFHVIGSFSLRRAAARIIVDII
jgi:hypothetical protein